MPTQDKRYNIQCINHGYCGSVGPGHELYEECQKREAEGYLDAMCLGPNNTFCGQCNDDRRRREEQDRYYEEAVAAGLFDDEDAADSDCDLYSDPTLCYWCREPVSGERRRDKHGHVVCDECRELQDEELERYYASETRVGH